jgi:tRNA (cytidine/uridine-2'-O-)-methyltransferase
MINFALYQPDIALNTGAAIRLAACLGVPLHVIEPCGFPWDEKKIRRSGMDYVNSSPLHRHVNWNKFKESTSSQRIILLSTKADLPYTAFQFKHDDILMVGRESAGVPDDVHEAADARIIIPMHPGFRSLNVINSAAMVLGEALRQTNQFADL